MDDQAYENIHVVASILKMYLRLLPIPLITYDVHPLVIKALGRSTLNMLNFRLKYCPINFLFFRNSNVVGEIS